ncbi:MAG: hypothetical protein QG594_2558, partial [Bacteroidota bacterium]|nr:hypothetical protein [Bacteroidota bacterium]
KSEKLNKTTEEIIEKIAITTINSIKVYPCLYLVFSILYLVIFIYFITLQTFELN